MWDCAQSELQNSRVFLVACIYVFVSAHTHKICLYSLIMVYIDVMQSKSRFYMKSFNLMTLKWLIVNWLESDSLRCKFSSLQGDCRLSDLLVMESNFVRSESLLGKWTVTVLLVLVPCICHFFPPFFFFFL